uniref:arginine--tRNA ligase n=1 Tax=Globisporangium ultimum (strain ATCC 200006 / CBS 805.95 / DAOM BR144) TaxID=431595 RepID=K3WKF0_GLOUD
MKLLISETHGAEELKCFLALALTGAKFTTGATDAKYALCGPQLAVANPKTKQDEVIFSANAVCRYVAIHANALQAEDLAVDEWIEWESAVLAPWVNKTKKDAKKDKTVVAAELTTLLDAKEQARGASGDTLEFLFGAELTLADVVAGVTLREALALVPVEDESETIKKFRAYVAQLFARAEFAKASAAPAKATKAVLELDADVASGATQHQVLTLVESIFDAAIKAAFPGLDIPAVEVTRTKNPKFGDYQCNSAMAIFTALKGTPNAAKSPRDVAQTIITSFPDNTVVHNLSVAGAGFINAFLTPAFVNARLRTVLRNGVQPSPQKKMNIVVDFSSPNIAKDMHVGHLRSTIIGDTLCRILEFQGHNVNRVNHVGDWGTQFGMLICHLTETYPNWETQMPDVQDLTKLYKAAKERFDADEDFHKRSKDGVVLLQSGDEKSLKVWQTLCEISRREFQKVYDRLGVTLREMGESFYNSIIPSVLDIVRSKGLMENSNGAQCVFTKVHKQPFLLVKSDGSYLYPTTDIAALWYRLHVLKADWIVIYTDYTQKDHFDLLAEVGRMSGILDPTKNRFNHVGFGTVNDESGKRFKTRSGEVVRLVELLDEAKARMKTQLLARIESGQTSLPLDQVDVAAEKIGYGAVKYFDLRQSPTSNYIFSFDRMLSTNGDTAVYLMFAYARLCSIIRKSGVNIDELIQQEENLINPVHATEVALAQELLQLPDVISFINKDLNSNRLCAYLYTLAEKVQTFVTACRVLGSEEQNSRLLLCEATLKVMQKCFFLLGIEPLDQI